MAIVSAGEIRGMGVVLVNRFRRVAGDCDSRLRSKVDRRLVLSGRAGGVFRGESMPEEGAGDSVIAPVGVGIACGGVFGARVEAGGGEERGNEEEEGGGTHFDSGDDGELRETDELCDVNFIEVGD